MLPSLIRRAMSTTGRSATYQDAIRLLNGLQSNAATIEAIRKAGGRTNDFAIAEMIDYLRRIGYQPSDLNALNVVHITGTKGKGSTSAFCERIIRGFVAPLGGSVGLFTSPHLCAVRERIRINGEPLSEELFAKFFFEIWDRLEADQKTLTPHTPVFPIYFRLLTLLSFHAFLSLKVSATVLEVGIGGLYDSTNIVPKPIVAGITSLGLDHQVILGNTIEEIARNKAGIFKPGCPALVVEQEIASAQETVKSVAEEVKPSSFSVVPVYPELKTMELGLPGAHQKINASLAVALTKEYFASLRLPSEFESLRADAVSPTVPQAFIPHLQNTRWPGRCQTVADPAYHGTTWYLDGSHTIESLRSCGEWAFGKKGMAEGKRVLVFNCTNGRSGENLLGALLKAGAETAGFSSVQEVGETFDTIIFCTNVTYADGGFKGDLSSNSLDLDDLSKLATQNALKEAWLRLIPSFSPENIKVAGSIQHAVQHIRALDNPQVLVAGSLHLVGGMMEVAGLADVALSME